MMDFLKVSRKKIKLFLSLFLPLQSLILLVWIFDLLSVSETLIRNIFIFLAIWLVPWFWIIGNYFENLPDFLYLLLVSLLEAISLYFISCCLVYLRERKELAQRFLKRLFPLVLVFFVVWFFARGWWWISEVLFRFFPSSGFISLFSALFMVLLALGIGLFLKKRFLSIPLFVKVVILPTSLIVLSLLPALGLFLWLGVYGDDPVQSNFQHLLALSLGGLYLTICSLPGLLVYSAIEKRFKPLIVVVGISILMVGAILVSYLLLDLDLRAKRGGESQEELVQARRELIETEEHLRGIIGLKKVSREELSSLKNRFCFPVVIPTKMAFNPNYYNYTDPTKDRSLKAELKEVKVAVDLECKYQKVELEHDGRVEIEEFSENYDFDFRKDYENKKLIEEIGVWSWGEREVEIKEGIRATRVLKDGGKKIALVWKQEGAFIIIRYLPTVFPWEEILKMARSME